jgi:hypothetical protein
MMKAHLERVISFDEPQKMKRGVSSPTAAVQGIVLA